LPEKLEIHKVFLRFSGFVSRKTCSPIRTLRFNQRFPKEALVKSTCADWREIRRQDVRGDLFSVSLSTGGWRK
jgi:hypothetical protein